jgi:hypothetical protein
MGMQPESLNLHAHFTSHAAGLPIDCLRGSKYEKIFTSMLLKNSRMRTETGMRHSKFSSAVNAYFLPIPWALSRPLRKIFAQPSAIDSASPAFMTLLLTLKSPLPLRAS